MVGVRVMAVAQRQGFHLGREALGLRLNREAAADRRSFTVISPKLKQVSAAE